VKRRLRDEEKTGRREDGKMEDGRWKMEEKKLPIFQGVFA
jgi:hypothetical protein